MLFDDVVKKYKTIFDAKLKEKKYSEGEINEAQLQFSIYIFILITRILFSLLTPEEKKYFESIKPSDQSKLKEPIVSLFTKYPAIKDRLNTKDAVQRAEEDLSAYLNEIFSFNDISNHSNASRRNKDR